MAKFLSNDLRKRIVDAYFDGRGSYREIAEMFGVGEASVNRVWNRYRKTGFYTQPPRRGGRKSKIGADRRADVQKMVQENTDAFLDEYVVLWRRKHKEKVSRSAMDRALRRHGFARKKKVRIAAAKISKKVVRATKKFFRVIKSVAPKISSFLTNPGFKRVEVEGDLEHWLDDQRLSSNPLSAARALPW